MKIKFNNLIIFLFFNFLTFSQENSHFGSEKLNGKIKSLKQNSHPAVTKFGEIVKGERITGVWYDNDYVKFNENGFAVSYINEFTNYTYLYNAKNQIIERKSYSVNEKNSSSKTTSTYAKEKKVEEITYVYNPEESLTKKYLWEYDESGNMIKTTIYNADNEITSVCINKYDKSGNNIESRCLDGNGETNFLTKYKYDIKKNKIEEKNINEDGSYTLKKYKYDTFLNIIEIIEEDSENVFLNHTQKFKYINNLLVEESMIDNIDNKVFSLKKYLFVFDKNKNWIKKTIIVNDIPKEIIERVIEYY